MLRMRWEAADDNISDTVVLSERFFDRKGLQRLVAPLTEAFCLLAAAFASGRRHAAAKRGWPDSVCFERKLPMCMQNYWPCWHEKLELNALLGFVQAICFSRSCRVFHFCCYSFNLWLPFVFPNAGERPVVPRKAGAPHSDLENCSRSRQQTHAKCIHFFSIFVDLSATV